MFGKYVPVTLAALLATGCASVTDQQAPSSSTFSPDIPVTRLEMPETPGKGHFQGLAYHGLNSRNLVLDVRSGQAEQQVTQDGEDEEPVLGAGYGITQRLSAGVRFRTDLRHLALKSRFQLLGEPMSTSGKGNFSLALGLGYGSTRHAWDDSNDDDCILWVICLDPDGETIEGRYALDIKEASLIAGYRPVEPLLLFGGGFYQDVNYHSRVTYIDENNPANTVSNSEIDAVWQRGGNLGLGYAFSDSLMLIMEYVRYDLDWDGKDGVDDAEAFTGGFHVSF